MSEQWKDIEGFEGLYQISSYGRVKRLSKLIHNEGLLNKSKEYYSKEMILKPAYISKGYRGVTLTKEGKRYPKKIHRLVAQAFIPNPCKKPQVNHIDCDKSNNHVTNLEWVSQYMNMLHAKEHGLLNIEKATMVKYHPVAQYDLSGNLIKEWKSLKEASESLGKPSGNIYKCCQRKIKSAYGFIWKYIEGEKYGN